MTNLARPCWHPAGASRNQYVWFEQTLPVGVAFEQAELDVIANSFFEVYVNDQRVALGHHRQAPDRPVWKRVELAPHLSVLSVEQPRQVRVRVHHVGAMCFQVSNRTSATFWASGQAVGVDGSRLDLGTPGAWMCRLDPGVGSEACGFSFAIGPIEDRDTRVPLDEAVPVQALDPKEAGWAEPVHEDLPPLLDEVWPAPEPVVHAAVRVDEARYGFTQAVAAYTDDRSTERPRLHLTYATELVVAEPTRVELSCFWGPHFLNGEPVKERPADPSEHGFQRRNHMVLELDLPAGRHLLYGEPTVLAEVWGVMLGVPLGENGEPRVVLSAGPGGAEARRHLAWCPAVAREAGTTEPDPARIPRTWAEFAERHPGAQTVGRLAPGTFGLPSWEAAWDTVDPEVEVASAPSTVTRYGFGDEYLGHVTLDVEGRAGDHVVLVYDEHLRADGLVDVHKCHFAVNTCDRFVLAGGRQRLRTFHPRAGQHLQVNAYAADPIGPAPRVLNAEVEVHTAALPVTGAFDCDDDVLSWAWTHGVRTIRRSAEEVFADGPHRERGAYLGDAYSQSLAAASFTTDRSVTRRVLHLFGDTAYSDGHFGCVTPTMRRLIHDDFSLIWCLAVRDIWRRTADLAFVQRCWPAMQNFWSKIGGFYAGGISEAGLWSGAEPHSRLFLDWGAVRPLLVASENAALNLFRTAALRASADVAALMGEPGLAESWRADADRVEAAIDQRLWSDRLVGPSGETRSGYLGGLLKDHQEPVTQLTPHIQALAVALEVGRGGTPGTPQHQALMEHLDAWVAVNFNRSVTLGERQGNIDLYFMCYLLPALYRSGRYDTAEQVMRQHWGRMRDGGAVTFWESLSRGVKDENSLCHGWGASPTFVLNEHLLGVHREPVGDGRLKVTVRPRVGHAPGSPLRASGRVPVGPEHHVHVSWSRQTVEEVPVVQAELDPGAPADLVHGT